MFLCDVDFVDTVASVSTNIITRLSTRGGLQLKCIACLTSPVWVMSTVEKGVYSWKDTVVPQNL